jgi:hypothetical protein
MRPIISLVLALTATAAALGGPAMRTGSVRYVWQYTLPLDKVAPLAPTEEVSYRLLPDGSSYGVQFDTLDDFRRAAAAERDRRAALNRLGCRFFTYINGGGIMVAKPGETGEFFPEFCAKRWRLYAPLMGLPPDPPADPLAWAQVDPDRGPAYVDQEHRRMVMCCPNNPQWRAYLKGIMTLYAREAGVEGFFFDGPNFMHGSQLSYCTCDYCMAKFRGWLRARYGTARRLRDLGLSRPEDATPALVKQPSPLRSAYNSFRIDCLAETLRELREHCDATAPATTLGANLYNDGNLFMSYWYGTVIADRMAGPLGYAFHELGVGFPGMLDGRKISNGPVWRYLAAADAPAPAIGMGHPHDDGRAPDPPKEAQRDLSTLFLAEATAAGANACYATHSSSYELDYDALVAWSRFAQRNGQLLDGATPAAPLAVWCSTTPFTSSQATWAQTVSRVLADAHFLHRMVTDRDVEGGRLGEVKALIIPDVPAATDSAIVALRAFVERGGEVVVLGAFGETDELGVKRDESGLRALRREGRATSAPQEDVASWAVGHGFVHIAGRKIYGDLAPKGPGRITPCLRGLTETLQQGETEMPDPRWADMGVDPALVLPGLPARLPGLLASLHRPLRPVMDGPSTVEISLLRTRDGRRIFHVVNYAVDRSGRITPARNLRLLIPDVSAGARLTAYPVDGDAAPEPLQPRPGGRAGEAVLPEVRVWAVLEVSIRP